MVGIERYSDNDWIKRCTMMDTDTERMSDKDVLG